MRVPADTGAAVHRRRNSMDMFCAGDRVMPRLPKVIFVGAHTYKLLLRKRILHKLKGKRHGPRNGKWFLHDGLIDYDRARIYLDKKFTGPRKYLILWHEVFHAMSAAAGWRCSELETEEMSKLIVQVLMDNPGIIPPPRKHNA